MITVYSYTLLNQYDSVRANRQHSSDLFKVGFWRSTDGVELLVLLAIDWLQLLELLQVELGHLVVDHVANGKVAREHLKQHEGCLDAMDCTLQRKDDGRFIDKQEKDERSLEENRQHPETCQLWYLEKSSKQLTLVVISCNLQSVNRLVIIYRAGQLL